jgi:HK97 family phage major capsid protein
MSQRELTERRARAFAAFEKIAKEVERDGGTQSDEQRVQMDQHEADFKSLDEQIARQMTLDAMERRMQGQPIGGTGDDRFDTELRKFSLLRLIAHRAGMNVDAGLDLELSNETARRSGRSFEGDAVPNAIFETRVTTTSATGSNIIPTDYRPDLYINLLYENLVVKQAGARVLNDLRGNVAIPKALTGHTATWFAENSAIPLSDATWGQVTLTPKHVGCLTELSRNMVIQPSPSVEELVRADFAANLARAVDAGAIQGTGTGAEPEGILATTGIGSVALGTNGGTPTWAKILELIGKLEDENVNGNAFVGNGKFSRLARQTLKTADLPGYLMDQPGSLAGYPYYSTALVPSNLTKGSGSALSALIFGRWSDLLIGYWSEFDLLVNPYESTAYSKGNIQIRGIVTMDTAVRYPESFAAIKDIIT